MALTQGAIFKRLLLGIAGSALIGGAIWLAVDWSHEKRMTARADAHVQEILSMLNLAMPDFHQRLDKVRTFISDNSVHKIDGAFRANQGRPDSFLGGLLAHAKGTAAEPIHMECSTRTVAMERIFKALGYDTRIIAIFNSEPSRRPQHAQENLRSHSFLEVMNPKTKRWETQDADYDIYWRRKSSGERISLADSAQSVDDIEPCGRSDCGWGHASREGIRAKKLIEYLDIISITAKERGLRFTLYTSRAELNRTYSKERKQGAFCEVEAKRCRHGFYDITKYSTYEPGLRR
jgi:hypothetical protein